MNEELQSTNEEMQTVNDELRERSIELNEVNAYLASILGACRRASSSLTTTCWSASGTAGPRRSGACGPMR